MESTSEDILKQAAPLLLESLKSIYARARHCMRYSRMSDMEKARVIILEAELNHFIPRLEEIIPIDGSFHTCHKMIFQAMEYEFNGRIICELLEDQA